MPIEYRNDSIFDSPAQVLVNPVNCVSVMGAGLALEFKKRWPEMFDHYKWCCDRHHLQPGRLEIVSCVEPKVLLFPTKYHWRDPARIEYIQWGLEYFVEGFGNSEQSFAFPKLGCGKGGLNWTEVRPLMERYLDGLEMQVFIHI